MLSEPIAYPLVLAAVATGVRALDRPSARSIAAFVGFVLLASFARLQFAVLLPCFLVALVGVLAREQRVKVDAAPALARRRRARARHRRSRGRRPRAQHRLLPELPPRRDRLRQPLLLARPERAHPRGRHRARAAAGSDSRSGRGDRASAHPRRARVRAPHRDGDDRVAAPGVDLRRHARGADAVHVLPRPAVGSVLSLIRRSRLGSAPDPRPRVARPADGGAHDSADERRDRPGQDPRARALRRRTDPAGLQRPRRQDVGRALPRAPRRDRARHARRVGPAEGRNDRRARLRRRRTCACCRSARTASTPRTRATCATTFVGSNPSWVDDLHLCERAPGADAERLR